MLSLAETDESEHDGIYAFDSANFSKQSTSAASRDSLALLPSVNKKSNFIVIEEVQSDSESDCGEESLYEQSERPDDSMAMNATPYNSTIKKRPINMMIKSFKYSTTLPAQKRIRKNRPTSRDASCSVRLSIPVD